MFVSQHLGMAENSYIYIYIPPKRMLRYKTDHFVWICWYPIFWAALHHIHTQRGATNLLSLLTGGHVFRAFLSLMKLAVSVEGVASTSNVLGCWIQDSRIELLQSQLPSFFWKLTISDCMNHASMCSCYVQQVWNSTLSMMVRAQHSQTISSQTLIKCTWLKEECFRKPGECHGECCVFVF